MSFSLRTCKKRKKERKKKPIYQIKLCKLHSDVARVPAPPLPPLLPQSCGIFTFSSSVQDGAKIEKNDASSYKAELNEISLSINRHLGCVWWEVLAAFFFSSLRVQPGFSAALGDVHSNSYRLPPAVQSVMLQWTFPSPSCSVCGSAWQNRERARHPPTSSPFLSLSVASLWPRRGGMVLGPTSLVSFF